MNKPILLLANGIVVSLLKIDNPISATTDWKSVEVAMNAHIAGYWRKIRENTPSLSKCQRGGRFLKHVGFQGWKLQCQITVSSTCKKPPNVQSSFRTKCPICHDSHRNFATCLKTKKLLKRDSVNSLNLELIFLCIGTYIFRHVE